MPRSNSPLACLLAVALAAAFQGCSDPRRIAARVHVETLPPAGMEVVETSSDWEWQQDVDGSSLTEVNVKYRTTTPLVSFKDGFSTAPGREIGLRMDAVKAWAESNLPPSDPTHAEILNRWKAARTGFLLKRIETLPGKEIDVRVRVSVSKEDGGWAVHVLENPASNLGEPDSRPGAPVEGEPSEQTALAARSQMADELEAIRAAWLNRQELAAASLAALRKYLVAGAVFEADSNFGPLRLVVSRSWTDDSDAIAVLSDQRRPRSSSRWRGSTTQAENGEFLWQLRFAEAIFGYRGTAPIFLDARSGSIWLLRATNHGLETIAAPAPNTPQVWNAAPRVDILPEPAD